jgi:hypothetical protein
VPPLFPRAWLGIFLFMPRSPLRGVAGRQTARVSPRRFHHFAPPRGKTVGQKTARAPWVLNGRTLDSISARYIATSDSDSIDLTTKSINLVQDGTPANSGVCHAGQ